MLATSISGHDPNRTPSDTAGCVKRIIQPSRLRISCSRILFVRRGSYYPKRYDAALGQLSQSPIVGQQPALRGGIWAPSALPNWRWSTHGCILAKQPALRTQTVEIESAMSAPFTTGAQLVEIVADVPCRVVFGEDPEATLDDSYLPANTPRRFAVNAGDCVAVIAQPVPLERLLCCR
jgi:hypothetical protein